MICREACKDDRRGARIVATAEGRDLLRRMWPVYHQAIQTHYLDHLGEDAEVVGAALERAAQVPVA